MKVSEQKDVPVSRFTMAVVARNAPHLCPAQVAALKGTDCEGLDALVCSMDDDDLSCFVLFLQEQGERMRGMLACWKQGVVPAAVEHLWQELAVDRRMLPVGYVLTVPTSPARRARNGAEAAKMLLGGCGGPG
jgi:hypothetical protein